MKTIVTHFYPDVDAISAVWLVKSFFSDWQEAAIAFVPAGSTLNEKSADADPDVLHVDTGLGRFDHHQSDSDTCAAKLVFEYLKDAAAGDEKHKSINLHHWHEEALERLVNVVNDIDHFRQVSWPEVTYDRYEFSFEGILEGWKLTEKDGDHEICERGMVILDGVYSTLVNKLWAEEEFDKRQEFDTAWGKGAALESINNEVIKLGLKRGFATVILKDPRKGHVRIKARPGTGADLTQAYSELQNQDRKATWYLHPSKMILLNGSSKNPGMKATKLKLSEIIEVLKRK